LYTFFALRVGEQAVGVKEMTYGIPFVVAGLVFAFVSVRQSAVVVGSGADVARAFARLRFPVVSSAHGSTLISFAQDDRAGKPDSRARPVRIGSHRFR
jgi:hypothetical protein